MLIDGKEWRLVPVEPTDEMREAGWKTRHEGYPLAQTYRAMLAAAPTPPAQAAPSDEEIDTLADDYFGPIDDVEPDDWRAFARALLSRYGQAAPSDDLPTIEVGGKVYKQQWFTAKEVRALLQRYGQAPAASAEPIRLEHLAVADENGLRWMSGRKMPAGVESVELYAVQGYGRAPDVVYATPVAAQAQSWAPAGPLRIECDPERFGKAPWHVTDGHHHAVGATPNEALNGFARYLAAQAPAAPVHVSDDVRAALLFALWHHQGGSSPVGQPIRTMLGIGQHDHMTKEQYDEAHRVHAALDRTEAPAANGDAPKLPPKRTVFNTVGGSEYHSSDAHEEGYTKGWNAAIDAVQRTTGSEE